MDKINKERDRVKKERDRVSKKNKYCTCHSHHWGLYRPGQGYGYYAPC